MKLAEALIERADLQRKLLQLKQRINTNALYQDGEQPAEDPNALLQEYFAGVKQLQSLIVKINLANNRVRLENGLLMVEAIAERDCLKATHSTLIELANEGTPSHNRYSRSEIKMVSAVDIPEIRKRADETAKQCRQLDTLIQQANWLNDI